MVRPGGMLYGGKYLRRIFFLRPGDRDSAPNGAYATAAPMEAVDPWTVKPGVRGELTERAWGRPFPPDLGNRV